MEKRGLFVAILKLKRMAIIIKIGKGLSKKYKSYTTAFGGLTADVEQDLQNKTLKQIAVILAQQYNINDGEIEIFNIGFNYRKPMD